MIESLSKVMGAILPSPRPDRVNSNVEFISVIIYLIHFKKRLWKTFVYSKFASSVQQFVQISGYPANETWYPAGCQIYYLSFFCCYIFYSAPMDDLSMFSTSNKKTWRSTNFASILYINSDLSGYSASVQRLKNKNLDLVSYGVWVHNGIL